MEHLSGGSLQDQLVRKGAVPLELALPLIFQVLMGADALHRAGLVHRDIKLTNVLVDHSGRVRLTDLGVAHHPDGTVDFHTIPGQALGTPGYGSPEQWTDPGRAAATSDVFATGVLLYRLLTRRKADRLHLAHMRPGLLAEIPESVRDLLLRATQHRPALRYPSARAMAEAVVRARDAIFGLAEADVWMEAFSEATHPHWSRAFDPLCAWLEDGSR